MMLLDAKTYFIIWPRFKYVIHLYDALVNLLSWSRGITSYFWTISLPNTSLPSPIPYSTLSSASSAWKQVAEKECRRLSDQQTSLLAIYDSNEKDDTTSWLNRTKWHKLFVGKDLKVTTFAFIFVGEINGSSSVLLGSL